jgi:hypothetical protein
MARPTVDADGFPLLPQSASGNTIRLVSGQAPGNDTPIDESNGKVEPARVKFQRHATGCVVLMACPVEESSQSSSLVQRLESRPGQAIEPACQLGLLCLEHEQ